MSDAADDFDPDSGDVFEQPPASPLIARLQEQHFAALDRGDYDDAADALRRLNDLRRRGAFGSPARNAN